MASWKEERDRLVAQTLAFVQQVAAAHPAAAQSRQLARQTTTTDPAPIDDTPAFPIATSSVLSDHLPVPSAPTSEIRSSEIGTLQTRTFGIGSPDAVPAATQFLTPAMLPNHAMYSAVSARADITQRVAAFKARQGQISREREAYYETMQAKIRTTLGNDSSVDRL